MRPQTKSWTTKGERSYFEAMGVYKKVLYAQAVERTGRRPIGIKWIDVNNADRRHSSRLVAKEFNNGMDQAMSSATRPLVRTAHLTRHIFSLFHSDLHAHAWLKSYVWRAHITFHESSPCAHVVCSDTLFDFSTFLSLLSIFSLIILSFLLAINFIFHDVVDKIPVHSSSRGPWHSCRVRPSHS